MKAWREFAMAAPEDCDREYDVYRALVNRKETGPGSSLTNTSPLHHRTPAAAVTAPSTTRSIASLRVLSSAVPADEFSYKPNTIVDDLSPGARRFYDLLVCGSSSPTPAASPRAPSSAGGTGGIPESAAASAPPEKDHRSVTTTGVASASGDITKDGLSPGARRIYEHLMGGSTTPASAGSEISTVLQDPTMPNDAPIAVDINRSDLAATVPMNCSSECPSHDADLPVSVFLCPMGCPDGAANSMDRNNTNVILHTLGNFNSRHDLLAKSDSLCSDTVIVPVPHVFDGIPVKTSEDANDDTSQDDQGLLNTEEVQFTASNGVGPTLKQLVLSQINFGAVHMQFPRPLHQAPAYWSLPCTSGCSWFLLYGSRNSLKSEGSSTLIWFQICHAGKFSLYSYGAAQIQWEIAWSTTTLACSIHYGRHLYLTLERPIVICYLKLEIEIKCSAVHSNYEMHLQWDPSGLTRNWLGVESKIREIACLLVGSYWTISKSGSKAMVTLRGLSFWRYPMLLVNQMMMKSVAAWYMICTKAGLYSTLKHAQQLLGADSGSPKWHHKIILQYPCGNGWSSLLLLIGWFTVPFLHWFWELPSAVPWYISYNVNAFLACLTGREALQHILQRSFVWALVEWTAGFTAQNSLGFQEEFYVSIKIEKLLGLHSSCEQYTNEGVTYVDSRYFEWKIPWYVCPCHAIAVINWLRMQPAGGLWTFKYEFLFSYAFLFSWDTTCTVDSAITIKNISALLSSALQYLEVGHYYTMTILLLSSHSSEAWVLYIPATSIILYWSKFMTWEISSSREAILTYTKQVLLSCDPGGSAHVLDAAIGVNWNSAPLPFSDLTWDPGGHMQHRLEGKPNLKEGGLSATSPVLGLGRMVGYHLLGFSPLRSHRRKHIQIGRGDENQGGLERKEIGRRLRPRPGLAGVACSPSSSLDSPLLLNPSL